MYINLNELNYYKNQARKEGFNGKCIDKLPPMLNEGHYAEIAVMGILGKVQNIFNKKKIKFWMECSAYLDRNGTDVVINHQPVQIKSKRSYNTFMDYGNDDNVYINTDEQGYDAISSILSYIYFEENNKIELKDIISVQDKESINSLWSDYIKKYNLDI
ncbi:hypothetical protein FPHOBKDP_00078 [Listeria phage LPJP1]|nr:hypothetical protein FPHOBKDP_00078 [Listeria phage LPJP1]